MYFFTAKFTKTQCEEENYGTTLTKVTGDWQIECKDIKMRMVNLYHSDSWTDCTFSVGAKQLVSAHKVVLAAASPVFAAMFFGGWPENSGPISIDDIEYNTFVKMLRYIYTDNADITEFSDAIALYYAAKKYMLVHLKTECLQYLIKNLTAEDCCMAYEFSQMFDENGLLDDCEKLMRNKTKEVLTSTGFLNASVKTVYFIFSLNTLDITSELDLFEAIERYAKFNAKCGNTGQSNMCENNQLTGLPNEDNYVKNGKHKNIENESGSNVEEYKKIENGVIVDCLDNQLKDSKLPVIANGNVSLKKESEETKDGTVEDSKSEWLTIRHVIKLVRFLTMSAKEFTSLPAVSSLLTQTEVLSILINIINPDKPKMPMPEGFSTMLENRCTMISNEEEDSPERESVKFRFTLPDCKYLEHGDEIHFPQVYCRGLVWKMILTLAEDECEVSMKGSGPENYCHILEIHIITKRGVAKRYEFDSESVQYDDILGLLDWQEIKSKYMENGAVCFEVEIKAF